MMARIYTLTAGWPTDPDNPDMLDSVRKRGIRGPKALLGAISLLIREVRPFFITVIDEEREPLPIQNPKASFLQSTLVGFADIDEEE